MGGALTPLRPDGLAALIIKEIIQRAKVDTALVEEVFFGCANQAGVDNRNVARRGPTVGRNRETTAVYWFDYRWL